MSQYLKISNAGHCPIESFALLGVSTARGDANKIGQFGSGMCHGINTCLRYGIIPIITSGADTFSFDCQERSMGDTKYNQVFAIINGVKRELGFALEFGALDWTKLEMGIREFVSNAIDQGDYRLEVVSEITNDDNRTSIFVEYTPTVEQYYLDINKHFLQFEGVDFVVGDNKAEGLCVYRKGVSVFQRDNVKSLFRYNLNGLKVDESRNADEWDVRYFAGNAMSHLSDEQADRLITAMVEDIEVFEVKRIDWGFPNSTVKDKLKAAFSRVYPGYVITSNLLLEYCSKKYSLIKAVSPEMYTVLRKCGIEVALVGGGSMGAEQGFMPIPVTTDCKRIFNRVWKKLENLELTNGKEKPVLAMFAKPMDCGSVIGGYYEDGTVYIDRNNVNASVVLEEIAHYITGAKDCSRDFQTFAFLVAGAVL